MGPKDHREGRSAGHLLPYPRKLHHLQQEHLLNLEERWTERKKIQRKGLRRILCLTVLPT